jgi:hypothetical protein
VICSCASRTRRFMEEEPPFVLRFESCPTCGRCDRFVLLEGGSTVLVGEAARRFFSCHRQTQREQERRGLEGKCRNESGTMTAISAVPSGKRSEA